MVGGKVGDNLAAAVRAAGQLQPTRPALICGSEQLTWRQLDARVDEVAGGLAGAGLRPGDRVALHLHAPEFVIAYYGVLRAGLVAVPLDPAAAGHQLHQVLADCEAAALLTDEPASPDTRADLRYAGGVGGLPAASGHVGEVGGGEDIAVLLYPSGSPGPRPAVMLSHRALLASLDQVARLHPPVVRPQEVVLLAAPLFHGFGAGAGLGPVIRSGATAVVPGRADPRHGLDLVAQHAVTVVVGTPEIYVAWSQLPDLAALAGLRLAVSGSAPLPPAVAVTLAQRAGLTVHSGYGLAQAGAVLTSTLAGASLKPDDGSPKPGAVGRPLPGVELALVDVDGDEVDEDEIGEVVVRGASLFSGYWPDGSGGPDLDGWFATGDLVHRDADGDLFLIGRRRELIAVSGFSVYPDEVEAVLRAHPDIVEAAVVPSGPSGSTGVGIKAIVVVRTGAELGADMVIAHCRAALARFKCPTEVAFMAELPHTATGRVARDRLST